MIESHHQINLSNSKADNLNILDERISLKYSSFNKVKFNITVNHPRLFVFSFPYSESWIAFVNSKQVKIFRANGIEQAVTIPSGNSKVEFRYWSWAAFGG